MTLCVRTRRLLALLLLPACLPAVGWGQLLPVGSEFQVNTYTYGNQTFDRGPQVGAAPNGQFVVIWQGSDYYDVSGRRFDSTGAPVGSEFQLRPDVNYHPALAVAPDATFIVVWTMPDSNDFGVFAQRFASDGTALGSEFQVNSYETAYQGFHPAAAADGAGNFVVVWESSLQDGFRTGVFAQIFDSAGNPRGSEFQVNSYTAGYETGQVAAGDPSGGFVVAWFSYRFDGVFGRELARRYDSAGDPKGDEFQINTNTLCSGTRPSLSIAPNGDLVAVWGCRLLTDQFGAIVGRRFDSTGTPLVEEFRVNLSTTELRGEPAVAHDERGGFLITWSSEHATGSFDVFGQRYASTGDAVGTEFQISTYTPYDQGYAKIAALPKGEFAVVWTSDLQDSDDSTGVFGQRFRTKGTPIQGKKLVIKNPAVGPTRNKLIFLAKDSAVSPPTGVDEDPRCPPLGSGTPAAGATIRVGGPGGEFEIALPCSGWIADTARRKFRYRDGSGASCQRVILTAGHLKAVCKGPQVDYSLGSPQDEVNVVLSAGERLKYCATFGASADVRRDGSNGRVYSATNSSSSAFCD